MGRCAIAAVVLLSTLPSSSEAARGVVREIDRLVRPYLEAQQTHALSVGLYVNGRKYVRHYGQLGETDDRKPDGDTLYDIGSLTQLFTGALLADAVVRNDVKIEQSAGKLLPPGIRMPRNGRPITLLDLATGVSGLPYLPGDMPNRGRNNPYKGYTDEMLMQFLNRHELRRQPGTEYEYSVLAYGLLGKLLSQRAGVDYDKLLRTRLTKPMRLSSTHVEIPERLSSRLAAPHNADLQPCSNYYEYESLHGGGAIRSSVDDLLDFVVASMDPPRNRLGAALDLAWSPLRPPLEKDESAMGLGWYISSDGHTRKHFVNRPGYRGGVYASREFGVGVVVLANSRGLDAPDLCLRLYRAAAGRDVPEPDCEPLAEVPPEAMLNYVGSYETAKGYPRNVSVDGDKLFIDYGKEKKYRLFPATETQWRFRPSGSAVTFRQNESGEWDSLEVVKSNSAYTATRVAEPSEEDQPAAPTSDGVAE